MCSCTSKAVCALNGVIHCLSDRMWQRRYRLSLTCLLCWISSESGCKEFAYVLRLRKRARLKQHVLSHTLTLQHTSHSLYLHWESCLKRAAFPLDFRLLNVKRFFFRKRKVRALGSVRAAWYLVFSEDKTNFQCRNMVPSQVFLCLPSLSTRHYCFIVSLVCHISVKEVTNNLNITVLQSPEHHKNSILSLYSMMLHRLVNVKCMYCTTVILLKSCFSNDKKKFPTYTHR